SAVRRRPVCQRVKEKPEPLPRLLIRQPERLEHFRLNILPVNSNAARAKLVAIQHQVVALRPALPRRGLELVDIFLENSRERMLRAYPRLLVLAPFEQREARDPREFPFTAVD